MRQLAVILAVVVSIITLINYTSDGIVMESISQILITLATVLTSAGAWQYYQNRLRVKHKEFQENRGEQTMFRDDLRERVVILEQKLEQAYREKNEVSERLALVMTELAQYKVRLEFLEKENERLKNV
jgi:hypothetical protein